MIRIAICDDKKYDSEKIRQQISVILNDKITDAFHIETFSSGTELCADEARLKQYQVFFLDINMVGQNGLKTAEIVRGHNKNALLVFVTAYIDYAMEGYKFEATRFIIKDMLSEMLPECIETIVQKLQVKNHKLLYNFQKGRGELTAEQIVYVESNRHKVVFHTRTGASEMEAYCLYEKLDIIEQQLGQYGFLRIHKSYLVNTKYIDDITKYKVILKTGDELPVPRNKYALVEERYYENEGKLM